MRIFPEPWDRLRRDAGLSQPAALAVLLAVWLVPASLAAFETYVLARMGGVTFPLWRAVAAQAPGWLAFGALTPLILRVANRLPLQERPRAGKLLGHAAAALGCGAVYAVTASLAFRRFSPYLSSRGLGETVLSWFLSALPLTAMAYAAVVGTALGVHWFLRHRESNLEAARLSAQLSEARLGALRMQLHPHFLFNSLNAATVLVRDRDHDRAERVLELLSQLLRRSLRDAGPHRIALADELDFIRDYLAVEQIRFPDRLRVTYDMDPAAMDALVPALVLQPLVENAIRHGISRRPEAGRVRIRAAIEGGRLRLEVEDDGPGPSAAADAPSGGTGVGLRNTRDRLAVLYGAAAACELEGAEGGGTVARVALPLERAPAETTGMPVAAL